MTPSPQRDETVGIVGAGLVGALLAVRLARLGWRVDLYEKRPDLRRTDLPGGRSIVMSLSDRGWRGLAAAGLDAAVRPTTIPKGRRLVHLEDGGLRPQPYGRPEDAIWTVDRKRLNCLLLDAAEREGVALHFQYECRGLDAGTGRLEFADLSGGKAATRRHDRIVGADGIFSRVRGELSAQGLVRDDVHTLEFGYRELSIPARPGGGWALPHDAVHVWPRPGCLLLALPNRDGSFTCMLIMRLEGEGSLAAVRTADELDAIFASRFPDAAPLMPRLAEEFFRHPVSNIFTVRCDPWHAGERVVLIGDACHAIAPFYAMGMNVGFEDVTLLIGLLERHGGDWGRAVPEFGARRKPDTDAIADLSLKNFKAIGQSTGDHFHLKWELERRIWELEPRRWRPLYSMIAFSHIPLSLVAHIHERQNRVVNALVAEHGVDSPDHPDLPRLAAALLSSEGAALPAV